MPIRISQIEFAAIHFVFFFSFFKHPSTSLLGVSPDTQAHDVDAYTPLLQLNSSPPEKTRAKFSVCQLLKFHESTNYVVYSGASSRINFHYNHPLESVKIVVKL